MADLRARVELVFGLDFVEPWCAAVHLHAGDLMLNLGPFWLNATIERSPFTSPVAERGGAT